MRPSKLKRGIIKKPRTGKLDAMYSGLGLYDHKTTIKHHGKPAGLIEGLRTRESALGHVALGGVSGWSVKEVRSPIGMAESVSK